ARCAARDEGHPEAGAQRGQGHGPHPGTMGGHEFAREGIDGSGCASLSRVTGSVWDPHMLRARPRATCGNPGRSALRLVRRSRGLRATCRRLGRRCVDRAALAVLVERADAFATVELEARVRAVGAHVVQEYLDPEFAVVGFT